MKIFIDTDTGYVKAFDKDAVAAETAERIYRRFTIALLEALEACDPTRPLDLDVGVRTAQD